MYRVLHAAQRFKLLLCFAKQLTVVSVASQPPNSPQKTVGVPLNVALGQQILTVQQSAPSSPGKAIVNHTTAQVQTDFRLISSVSASHRMLMRIQGAKLQTGSPKVFLQHHLLKSWQKHCSEEQVLLPSRGANYWQHSQGHARLESRCPCWRSPTWGMFLSLHIKSPQSSERHPVPVGRIPEVAGSFPPMNTVFH